jgi:hypothetical protein
MHVWKEKEPQGADSNDSRKRSSTDTGATEDHNGEMNDTAMSPMKVPTVGGMNKVELTAKKQLVLEQHAPVSVPPPPPQYVPPRERKRSKKEMMGSGKEVPAPSTLAAGSCGECRQSQ